MTTRKPLTLASTVTALLLGITGCTLPGSNPQSETTPPTGSTTTTTTAEPTATAVTTEPTATAVTTEPPAQGTDPETIREGIYLDMWARNVNTHFQRAANAHRFDNEGTLAPGDLQAFLDEQIAADTPDAFEVKATTTASNNFTIKTWHPSGHAYKDESTAYIGSSDPEVTSTPTPTPTPSNPAQQLDAQAPEVLYNAILVAGRYLMENDSEMPSDEYMRTEGKVPEGWEWEISQNDAEPGYFLFKVWHPDAYLFNSHFTSASYNSFPQPEMRPHYNVDVMPYVPVTGFTIPESELTPAPSPPADGANT